MPQSPQKTTQTFIDGDSPLEVNGQSDPAPDTLAQGEVEDTAPDAQIVSDSDYGVAQLEAYLRALPGPLDDIDARLGPEVKKKMLLDSVLGSTINWLGSAALDRELSFEPLISEKKNPDYGKSLDCYDHCMRTIEPIIDDLPDLLEDMVNQILQNGHKVGEKICSLQLDGPDAGQWYFRDIRPLAYDSYSFICDPFKNVPALLCRTVDGVDSEGKSIRSAPSRPTKIDISGSENGVYGGTGIPLGWRLIPRDKFAIMTLRSQDRDPRGFSVLRGVYNEWWLTQSIFPHYLKYLLKFATPSIVVTAPEGPPTVTIAGKKVRVTSMLLKDLKDFENASVTALPGGATFQLVQSNGQGEAFLGAFSMLASRMQIGLTNQVLASAEGKHMARAAAETHQDSRNVGVRLLRRVVSHTIRRDLFKFILRLNRGKEFEKFAPLVGLGSVEPEDMAAVMTAVATLKSANYFVDEQAPMLDKIFGFKVREEPKFAQPPTPPAAAALATLPVKGSEKAPVPLPGDKEKPEPKDPAQK